MNSNHKLAVVIPVYNHEESIGPTLKEVLAFDYPVLLIDDGCQPSCRDVLVKLVDTFSDRVSLLRLERNSGKGGALKAGFSWLKTNGFSHAIQIDSDGQHDLSDLPGFVDASLKNPAALVTGYPVYDASVPKVRYYCRYFTHVWVWINTLSFHIKDTMCGFRVYPVDAVVDLLRLEPCGDRMDFDPEIIVRWHWRGYAIVNLPTKVKYPSDGVSHFHVWHDNWLISAMHARLFFGMLYRLPGILWQRISG